MFYWVSGLCLQFSISKTTRSGNWIFFRPKVKREENMFSSAVAQCGARECDGFP
jgi:hypothetical protein